MTRMNADGNETCENANATIKASKSAKPDPQSLFKEPGADDFRFAARACAPYEYGKCFSGLLSGTGWAQEGDGSFAPPSGAVCDGMWVRSGGSGWYAEQGWELCQWPRDHRWSRCGESTRCPVPRTLKRGNGTATAVEGGGRRGVAGWPGKLLRRCRDSGLLEPRAAAEPGDGLGFSGCHGSRVRNQVP